MHGRGLTGPLGVGWREAGGLTGSRLLDGVAWDEVGGGEVLRRRGGRGREEERGRGNVSLCLQLLGALGQDAPHPSLVLGAEMWQRGGR